MRVVVAVAALVMLAVSGCMAGDDESAPRSTPQPAEASRPDPETPKPVVREEERDTEQGAGASPTPADSAEPPLDESEVEDTAPTPTPVVKFEDLVPRGAMTFVEKVVDAAVHFGNGLYEPTMEVSDTGTIYVAGHVIAADTTGTPAFFSVDDGETWEQLPFAGSLQTPYPLHGAAPPPGDEGFIVAGDDGQAWMVDITLATFPVSGWCGEGAELCYHNPDAYDEVAGQVNGCQIANLNDRPWAAYADGTLLMVNNPGGGPVQVGVMDVPPPDMVGLPLMAAEWNMCASPGGWIPGIPDMRDDGLFAVPQVEDDQERLIVVLGNKADIHDVQVREVFPFTSEGGLTSNYGQAAFDAEGDLYIFAASNVGDPSGNILDGQFKLAVSQDGGASFEYQTFSWGGEVQTMYMDGNIRGPGALLTWAVPGKAPRSSDYYAGHAYIDPDGRPIIENVYLAIAGGPEPSGHVVGAAAGPDGRAYLVTDAGGAILGTPLAVTVQMEGATLPPLGTFDAVR